MHRVRLSLIYPGKARKNADIEQVDRSVRGQVIDGRVKTSITDVRYASDAWRHRFDIERSN